MINIISQINRRPPFQFRLINELEILNQMVFSISKEEEEEWKKKKEKPTIKAHRLRRIRKKSSLYLESEKKKPINKSIYLQSGKHLNLL